MSATLSPSQDVLYSVALCCRVFEVPSSSFYDWRKRESVPLEKRPVPKRRGPKPRHSDEELAELIREVFFDTEEILGIRGEGHRKVHARLRFRGISVGKDRVLRVMREHGLLSPTRVGRKRGPKSHDETIRTLAPDVMWGTDATRIATRQEGEVWVFAVLDHCTGQLPARYSSSKVPLLSPRKSDHGPLWLGSPFQIEVCLLKVDQGLREVTVSLSRSSTTVQE